MASKHAHIASKYRKMDQREHVLARPGMYVGSIVADKWNTYVFDREAQRMVKKELVVVPALYKIFDEILVNAIDHVTRLKQLHASGKEDVKLVRNIAVSFDKATGRIEVYNDGDGLEAEKHPEHHIWIPEMVFGHLLTSANYDDSEERVVGGQNGIGAKACNIFSSVFEIETVDHRHQKIYRQTFYDNMSRRTEPEVKRSSKKTPHTRISFIPDYARLGLEGLTDDMLELFEKRVYDTCALTESDITVSLNGVKIDCKTFERYVDLYLGPKNEHPRVYDKIGDRWEVVASYTESLGFEQVSFVNGIWTVRGGKHVEQIANQVCTRLGELIEKRRKATNIKPAHIKSHLVLFVKCLVSNPTFDSQTKDLLTTPVSRFGSKIEIDEKFADKLYKTGIVDKAVALSGASEDKQLKKTDGRKTSTIRGIVKLDDATWAGTTRSRECTLILTEGDSAKAMALSGLEVVGRERYGVFPLRGKLLNVQDVAAKKLAENEEISSLKKILGLESGKDYASVQAEGVWPLRYGRIMLMTDSDADGSHIKGLLFNLFHTLWPSLFSQQGFLCSLLTPIVKVRKGSQNIQFYNLTDYNNWVEERKQAGDHASWEAKYYKGLATSKDDEARGYFKEMRMVEYLHTAGSDISTAAIDLAFNKKRADDRKDWLGKYDRQSVLKYEADKTKPTFVPYEDFVHKDLIHFSNYDVERSIPSAIDGLKISQRKAVFGCFKRNLVSEVRVAQLAAYVSEHTAYHHGEASLQATIIGMAQDFVGSNNINLLMPNGQFGTRVQGGKNAGSPRYIYTELSKAAFKVFRPDDGPVLSYMEDDGQGVEPEWYAPIIPMVLVNGAVGIGTGFSTNVPCYNPKDVISVLRHLLEIGDIADEDADITPWYRGFTGSIVRHKGKWVSKGRWERIADAKVRIVELPVGTWTEDYKEMLEGMLDKGDIKAYESNYYNDTVDFVVTFASSDRLDQLLQSSVGEDGESSQFETLMKLTSSKNLGTNNMYLFNASGQIKKYSGPGEIIKEFASVRLVVYNRRKAHQLKELEDNAHLLRERIRFLQAVIDGVIEIAKLNKARLEERLEELGFAKFGSSANYDYLVRMPIYNLTLDKKFELEAECAGVEARISELRARDVSSIWIDELNELEDTLFKLEGVRSKARADNAAGPKAIKAKAGKRALKQ